MASDFANAKFVVIEPDFNLRNMVMKILRDAGARHTETFGSITQAAPFLRESEVNLVICEMDQSPIDGTGFAHALRGGKIRANTKTPLLLMGTDSGMERIQEAIKAGANGILLKPFSAADLIKRARKLILT